MKTEEEVVIEETETQEEPKIRLKKDGTPAKKRGRKPGTKNKAAKKKATKKKASKRGPKKATQKKKPGRKAGFKMKRDKQGRLLKKDGTLANKPGRKSKSKTKTTSSQIPTRLVRKMEKLCQQFQELQKEIAAS